jgi:hypothetical protein
MSTGQPVACRHAGAAAARHLAGTLCLAITLIGASRAASPEDQTPPRSAANAAAATSSTGDADSLATIVVTGTSIQSVDSAAYQSAPVSITTADTIQKSGAANLEAFFQTQPNFVLSGQSSFSNAGGQSGANGTNIGATTLNLRGLGPQYTLVLVNGRHFQAEDPANIDLIPVDAIERVEVLKSGASAVYGSDAVAGVVNIITKHNADGFSFDGYYGESGQGDDSTRRFSASWGTSSDYMNLLVVSEYFSRGGLTQGQRTLSADPDLSRFNSGFDYQTFSYSSLAQIILPTEVYPWDASVDEIRSVIFDPGWQQRWGVTAGDLQSRTTGKRLTMEEFNALRSGTADDGVLMHMNTEETITKALQDPLVLVASDSMDIVNRYSHPRSAGTFARVLGHYVRETGALTLSQAIRKMSLMPAQRLEAFVPAMKKKGRLQVGADADLILFDPQHVSERARYLDAKEYSKGILYVMVNGQLVVRRGALVSGVFPGKPVYSQYRRN